MEGAMSGEGMNSDQIAQVFGSLARIEQKIDSAATSLTQHVADDKEVAKALFGRIEILQLSHAKQKGALTVLGTVGSMLGAGVGYLIERWTVGHH
jgi:hypothetical protein